MMEWSFGRGKWWVITLVVSLILGGGISTGHCAKMRNFSADQVTVDPSGKVLNSGKVFMAPEKIRMEFQPPDSENTMVNIFRQDTKIHWMLNPKAKTYFERPLDEQELNKALNMHVTKNEEILGTETINGFKCTKKRVQTKVKYFGFSRTLETTVWESPRLDLPLKTESEDGTVTELRNIKSGRQPAKLFKVPSDYQKVATMVELVAGGSGTNGGGTSDEDSGFKIPKDISDKLPDGLKNLFGGSKDKSE